MPSFYAQIGYVFLASFNDGATQDVTISYQDARSLILGAIDYARSIEISSSRPWNEVFSFFIEGEQPYDKKFSFGKDGVPFYVMRSHDQENYNIEEIIAKVEKANGHFLMQAFMDE